ncbi:MAG: hypothetical protein Q9223_003477 [Gallowayella weberi]
MSKLSTTAATKCEASIAAGECNQEKQLKRSRQMARTTREEPCPIYFNYLPPELVIEVMRWTNPAALINLVDTKNTRISAIASTNWRTILLGVSTQQFSEFHDLFGMYGKETPDQEYNLAVAEESGEWWARKDDEALQKSSERACRWNINEAAASTPIIFHEPHANEESGRIELFVYFAKEIEAAATALDKEIIEFDAGSGALTKKALMLFWKMQWNDLPGLDRLCKRDETDTDRYYFHVRLSLFTAETPEVQARFQEIIRAIGSRLWNGLKFWDFTSEWSMQHEPYITTQWHISVSDLEIWLQDLIAELTVEVICKIGISRAIELDHADYCSWRTEWINERMSDRLMDFLRDLPQWLRIGYLPPVLKFGRAIGLLPEEIAQRRRPILSDWIYVD